MATLKLIARYRDGRMVKGTSYNFAPDRPAFHVAGPGAAPGGRPVEVRVRDLKAVFVVRSFEGDPHRARPRAPTGGPAGAGYGRKLEVTFDDGEVLRGTSVDYDQEGPCFFLTPEDPTSNNLRIMVVRDAVLETRPL